MTKQEIIGCIFMENDLHFNILPPKQFKLLNVLCELNWMSGFYLAGGTALALQIGHRKSVDFDFFTSHEIDMQEIKGKLVKVGNFKLYSESEGTLHGNLKDIEISFFQLPWGKIEEPIAFGEVRIASRKDIAAMKLSAISSRGSKKDFIDLFFLLKEFSLAEMLGFYRQKYGENLDNIYCVMKGLIYFKDADQQEMPIMCKRINWRTIKKTIIFTHDNYIKRFGKRFGGL